MQGRDVVVVCDARFVGEQSPIEPIGRCEDPDVGNTRSGADLRINGHDKSLVWNGPVGAVIDDTQAAGVGVILVTKVVR